jgi:hypothetical protein
MVPIKSTPHFVCKHQSFYSSDIPKWKNKQTNIFGCLVGVPRFLSNMYSFNYIDSLCSDSIVTLIMRHFSILNQGRPNNI